MKKVLLWLAFACFCPIDSEAQEITAEDEVRAVVESFFDALRGGADYHSGVGRHHLMQYFLEPLPFGVGKLAADSRR